MHASQQLSSRSWQTTSESHSTRSSVQHSQGCTSEPSRIGTKQSRRQLSRLGAAEQPQAMAALVARGWQHTAMRRALHSHVARQLHTCTPRAALLASSPSASSSAASAALRPRVRLALCAASAACATLAFSTLSRSQLQSQSQSHADPSKSVGATREAEAAAEADSVTSTRDLRTEETKKQSQSEAGGGLRPRKAEYDPAVGPRPATHSRR